MPYKPGIFTRFQGEILELIENGVGYTEITKIIYETYGIKTSKQNLEKPHKRYLEKASEPSPKSASETRRKDVRKVDSKRHVERKGKGAKKVTVDSSDPNAARRELAGLFLEFQALLDRELSSGRFLHREARKIKAFGELLFGLHPATCLDVFQSCHGWGFADYEREVLEALQKIGKDRLYESSSSLKPTSAELVNYLCIFATEDGEETTLADRIPNIEDAYKVALREAKEERERLGEDGFISL